MCTYQYELHVYHVVLMVNKINLDFTLGNSNVFVDRIECHNTNENWNSNFLPNVVSVIHIFYYTKKIKILCPFIGFIIYL